jgi:hypothetical protein
VVLQKTGWNIENISLFSTDRRASGQGRILLGLLLSAVWQGCAPTDVHVHVKPAISAASSTVQQAGPSASEFLVAAKLEGNNLAALIQQLLEKGMAVLFISSELPEVVDICDRVLVMRSASTDGD